MPKRLLFFFIFLVSSSLQAQVRWTPERLLQSGGGSTVGSGGYSYEIIFFDLAHTLAKFLRAHKSTPPFAPGIFNPLLESLDSNQCEKFCVVVQDNIYMKRTQGLLGQEISREEYLKELRLNPSNPNVKEVEAFNYTNIQMSGVTTTRMIKLSLNLFFDSPRQIEILVHEILGTMGLDRDYSLSRHFMVWWNVYKNVHPPDSTVREHGRMSHLVVEEFGQRKALTAAEYEEMSVDIHFYQDVFREFLDFGLKDKGAHLRVSSAEDPKFKYYTFWEYDIKELDSFQGDEGVVLSFETYDDLQETDPVKSTTYLAIEYEKAKQGLEGRYLQTQYIYYPAKNWIYADWAICERPNKSSCQTLVFSDKTRKFNIVGLFYIP